METELENMKVNSSITAKLETNFSVKSIFPGKYVLIRKPVKKVELIFTLPIRKILAGLKSEKERW